MKPPLTLPSLAALLLAAGLSAAVHAQMGTPAPPGPPSAQPAPKAPSQPSPATRESIKDSGGPQITVPLKRPQPAPPVPQPSATASAVPDRADALRQCKALPTRQARRDCRKRVGT